MAMILHDASAIHCEVSPGLEHVRELLFSRAFRESVWSRRSFVLQGAIGEPREFLDLEALAPLVLQAIEGEYARVEMRHRERYKFILRTRADFDSIAARFRQGGHFHTPELERIVPASHSCATLETLIRQSISAPLSGMSLFVSPPCSSGLPVHHDDEDVFSFQLRGSKTWRLHEIVAPQESMELSDSVGKDAPVESVTLNAGDMLYVPRGMVHDVCSGPYVSVSVCIAYRHADWLDMALGALRSKCEQNPEFFDTRPFLNGEPPDSHALNRLVYMIRDCVLEIGPQDLFEEYQKRREKSDRYNARLYTQEQ